MLDPGLFTEAVLDWGLPEQLETRMPGQALQVRPRFPPDQTPRDDAPIWFRREQNQYLAQHQPEQALSALGVRLGLASVRVVSPELRRWSLAELPHASSPLS